MFIRRFDTQPLAMNLCANKQPKNSINRYTVTVHVKKVGMIIRHCKKGVACLLAFLRRPSPFCRHLRRAIPRNSRLASCENVQTVLFVVRFVSFLWFMTTTFFFLQRTFQDICGLSACTVLLDQKHLVEDWTIICLSLLAVYFHLKLSLHTPCSTSCSTSST